MAELKRNFLGARMNKDVDERLLKPGEYRDANNIEISTSEGSDVGTVQTIKGNTKRETMASGTGVYGVPDTATCVGSIADKETDKIYYFLSGGDRNDSLELPSLRKNYILEYDTVLESHKYVFVDIFEVNTTCGELTEGNSYIYIPAPDQTGSSNFNTTGVRIGMTLTTTGGYNENDEIKVTDIKYETLSPYGVSFPVFKITLSKALTAFNIPVNAAVKFISGSVLRFKRDRLITGVNILDGFIYWTDDFSEPKKINIKRSIMGTGGTKYLVGGSITGGISDTATANSYNLFTGDTEHFHTRLVIKGESTNPNTNHIVVTNPAGNEAVYVKEDHITVIKKAPTQPLDLEMYRSVTPRLDNSGAEASVTGFVSGFNFHVDGELLTTSSEPITFELSEARDFRKDDILTFSSPGSSTTGSYSEWQVKVKVTSGVAQSAIGYNPVTEITGQILNISKDIASTQDQWNVKRETGDTLFEFKFPRFSYRYKYQDGEYSTFAPFSQVAFLPDVFDYATKQGYNLGMINQLKSLKLKGYFGNSDIRPRDISEIDILYKETNNPTVYVLRTLTANSKGDLNAWPDLLTSPNARGEVTVNSDNIYSVVPSNQLLRPWDNVPLFAKSQEISANRLIYGNYVQNFNVPKEPKITFNLLIDGASDADWQNAGPSIKSLRDYSIGVVYSDDYGRETPVLFDTPKSIKTLKENSSTRNRFQVSLSDDVPPPSWAKYFSYYIKETSTEYYNLVMDRWYDAGDGNVWLSFPSAERNKIDEDTYIKLKKKHGSNTTSTERARYKVLSIENEAPDAVKKNRVIVGTLFNSGFIGNSEEGYPLQGFTYFMVQATNFNASIDIGVLQNASETSVRFGGAGLVSNHYEIVSVTTVNDKYRIELKTPIGPDAAFASASDTFASAIQDLYVEFFEMKTENKAEFDGRFFVKINSDQALRSEVLFSNDTSQRTIIDSKALRYLNNNGYVTETMYTGPKTIRHLENGYSGTRDLHPTEYSHHTNPALENQAKYFWGGNVASGGGLSVPSVAEGISGGLIAFDPVEALNGNGATGGAGSSRVFWRDLADKGDFFIDFSTAYTFTSFIGEIDYSGVFSGQANATSGTDNYFNGPFGSSDEDYIWEDLGSYDGTSENLENPEWLEAGAAPVFNGSLQGNASNLVRNIGGGLPSRGIWHNNSGDGSYMDISWTGMGVGYDGTNEVDQPFVQMLQQVVGSEVHSNAAGFILKLTTPGTVFRFQNDPDGTEYTVQKTTVNSGNEYAYDNPDFWEAGTNRTTGAFGIRNSRVTGGGGYDIGYRHYQGWNMRQRWTIAVTPKIGSSNSISGYNPIHGTMEGGPTNTHADYRRALHHDATDNDVIEILGAPSGGRGGSVEESAIWETEPKEAAELDIYYQASGLNPIRLSEETNEEFIPIGSTFSDVGQEQSGQTYKVTSWENGNTFNFTPNIVPQGVTPAGTTITFTKPNGAAVTAAITTAISTTISAIELHGGLATDDASQKLYTQTHTLNWSNCWMFGNGVESDRIRDDFNEVQLDNGVKASSTISGISKQERRKHGLIWSGIYNSASGINDTNQFIMAEKITKDINPIYGSIQKLYNRNTRLLMFCEDKILRAVTNKDALYNADGNPQLVASNAVIGDVTSYQGEYGISTDAASFAETPYAIYFADSARAQVLRLTTEGVVSISDKGMRDYFADYMSKDVAKVVGSYDERSKEYNLTISKQFTGSNSGQPTSQTTTSYSDISGGWSSFKSFYPQNGISINSTYYTFFNGHIWEHYHKDAAYNTFYGSHGSSDHSSVTLIVNDSPGSVKSFGAINYEGSQAKVSEFSTTSVKMFNNNYAATAGGASSGLAPTTNVVDGEYHNLTASKGWYADNITTDLQTSGNIEFKEKEGKWFGYPSGETTSLTNLNEKEFTVQGLGTASITHDDASWGARISISIENNDDPLFNAGTNDGTNVWDGGSDIARLRHIASVSTGVFEAQAGVLESHNVVFEITNNLDDNTFPISDRPWSGYYIEAKNFVVGNGNLAASFPSIYIWNGSGTNWNVNPKINTVTFTDTGTPGDANNTVLVTCSIPATSFSATETLYIDIDINEDDPPSNTLTNDFAIQAGFIDVAADTHATTSDYTVTNVGTSPFVYTNFTGTAVGNAPVEVAKIVFTANSGQRYIPTNTIVDFGPFNTVDGLIDDLYTHTAGEFVTDANGNVTSFTVRIFHNNVSLSSQGTDPAIYGHSVFITRDVQEIYVEPAEPTLALYTASWVNSDQYYDPATDTFEIAYVANNSWIPINVSGSGNTPYRVSLQKKTGLHSITTAATNGYYNFETHEFQTAPCNFSATTNTLGSATHQVYFPSVSDATRYDLVFSNELTYVGGNVTFGNSVPTAAGDAIITNCGTETLTVNPVVYESANFGVIPDDLEFIKVSDCTTGGGEISNVEVHGVGGTAGVSSDRLVLNLASTSIFPGMIVTASGVAHNTTVLSISEKAVTLSAAATVANNTDILFTKNSVSLLPFSFTIPPNGSGDALSVNAAGIANPNSVGGLRARKQTINGTAAKTITHTLDSTKGVVPGMAITGAEVKVASGTNLTVASVTNGTVIVLSEPQSFLDNAALKFSGGNSDSSLVNLHSIQANKIGSNIVVSGYINALKIASTARVDIYLDDIIDTA
tara:strand:- start:1865 stop:9796 length:7932 start_codon:yes stop_codon:yes gene_type:complete